jgi:hypothetical protein
MQLEVNGLGIIFFYRIKIIDYFPRVFGQAFQYLILTKKQILNDFWRCNRFQLMEVCDLITVIQG